MTNKLEGRVAFITGAARGQGRAHAVRLARDGVDIIGIDICEDIPTMNYPCGTWEELQTTAELVEKEGRRMVIGKADVRDRAALQAAFDQGFDEFGRVDIVIANAAMLRLGPSDDPIAEWQDTLDIILTGTHNTVEVAVPRLREGGRGGSIVLVSSVTGLKGVASSDPSPQAYATAKRGLIGYMQVLANLHASEMIRVNTIHPTGVVSAMTTNEAILSLMAQSDGDMSAMQNALPIQILQPEDIANAVAFLVSDEAKFITGIAWPLDAGFSVR